mmetsp:Transcript_1949/g.3714  ORF Transcript_1949/g.3714 Transcript_1949/m.3714 type:complete len:235 (+) Transcript_1949:435-1139(+)
MGAGASTIGVTLAAAAPTEAATGIPPSVAFIKFNIQTAMACLSPALGLFSRSSTHFWTLVASCVEFIETVPEESLAASSEDGASLASLASAADSSSFNGCDSIGLTSSPSSDAGFSPSSTLGNSGIEPTCSSSFSSALTLLFGSSVSGVFSCLFLLPFSGKFPMFPCLCRFRKLRLATGTLQCRQYRNLAPALRQEGKLQRSSSPCSIVGGMMKYAVLKLCAMGIPRARHGTRI